MDYSISIDDMVYHLHIPNAYVICTKTMDTARILSCRNYLLLDLYYHSVTYLLSDGFYDSYS